MGKHCYAIGFDKVQKDICFEKRVQSAVIYRWG